MSLMGRPMRLMDVRDDEKDTSLRARGTAKWHEGYTYTASASIHQGSCSSQTPIWRHPLAMRLHSCGLMVMGNRAKAHTLRDLRTTMSPDGPKERTGEMHPSAKGLRPWGSTDASKRRADAPLRGLPPGHAPSWTQGSAPRGAAIHEQGADVAVFTTSSTGRAVPGHSTARAKAQEKGSKRARRIRPSKVSRDAFARSLLVTFRRRHFRRTILSSSTEPSITPQDPVAPFDRLVRSGALRLVPPGRSPTGLPPPYGAGCAGPALDPS